jgi:hypothetical protein
MRQRDKLLTAAVAALGYNADGITNPVFDEVDFLNLMVYDESDSDFLILVTVLVDMARRNREFRSATR